MLLFDLGGFNLNIIHPRFNYTSVIIPEVNWSSRTYFYSSDS